MLDIQETKENTRQYIKTNLIGQNLLFIYFNNIFGSGASREPYKSLVESVRLPQILRPVIGRSGSFSSSLIG